MATGTQTFGLDETFIEPQVLSPPPTRHALFIFVVLLASILHVGTAGWSEIHNGAEGYYASAAREMFRTGSWAPPSPTGHGVSHEPPLGYWLIKASFEVFGVSPAAARFPIAAATIASVALTFLIGERLRGYWRGFIAALLHLCCLGTFIWGRIVTPQPIFAACIGATIFCAICGYQRQRHRRWWFAGVWCFAALAWMANGMAGLLLPAAIFAVLALLERESRIRFRQLLDWRYVLLFSAFVLPWHIWIQVGGGESFAQISWPQWLRPFAGSAAAGAEGMPIGRFLLVHLAWWFPLVLLVLPAVLFAPTRLFRTRQLEFAEALPLVWIGVTFLPLIVAPHRQDYASASMWSALALWIAWAWDQAPRALRLAGIALTLLVGVVLAGTAALAANVLPILPPSPWPTARGVVALIGVGIVASCTVAAYFAWRNREDFAIASVMLGMVPIGLGAAEAMARHGAHFSLADVTPLVQPQPGAEGTVLFEGTPHAGSSLPFYLDREPVLIGDPAIALEKMASAEPVYLIVHKDRVPFWQRQLTQRFHLYHQIGTCGLYVVIDNQP
jgi:4-amino-4-deoxy-L-arabinose transferase-like glycosyltransferase